LDGVWYFILETGRFSRLEAGLWRVMEKVVEDGEGLEGKGDKGREGGERERDEPSSSMSSAATCCFLSVRVPRRLEKKLLSPESPAWREATSAAPR
jgi:hypothetical protein